MESISFRNKEIAFYRIFVAFGGLAFIGLWAFAIWFGELMSGLGDGAPPHHQFSFWDILMPVPFIYGILCIMVSIPALARILSEWIVLSICLSMVIFTDFFTFDSSMIWMGFIVLGHIYLTWRAKTADIF